LNYVSNHKTLDFQNEGPLANETKIFPATNDTDIKRAAFAGSMVLDLEC